MVKLISYSINEKAWIKKSYLCQKNFIFSFTLTKIKTIEPKSYSNPRLEPGAAMAVPLRLKCLSLCARLCPSSKGNAKCIQPRIPLVYVYTYQIPAYLSAMYLLPIIKCCMQNRHCFKILSMDLLYS